MLSKVEIFCCYAREDKNLLEKLKSHLSPLQRQGFGEVWDDRGIDAGAEREQEIMKHLDNADIILLLISSDFISSDHCYKREMKRAIARHKQGKAIVIPILLRAVDWENLSIENTTLSSLLVFPDNRQAITSWENRDEAYSNVTRNIDKVARGLLGLPLISKAVLDDPTRKNYLEAMRKRYGSIELFVAPNGARSFSLQAIFQPLKLRSNPLIVEDLKQKEHGAIFGEPKYHHDDPRLPQPDVEFLNELPSPHSPRDAYNGPDALQKSPHGRMVVLGGPGTGKSTVLKHLVDEAAKKAQSDETALIPIFVVLSDFASSMKTLPPDQTLRQYLSDWIDTEYANALWNALQEGRMLICLDGLDEVTPNRRKEVIEWINDIATEQGKGNYWIVGSRFTEYTNGQFTPGQFTEWELQPLDQTHRHRLAQGLLPELQRSLHRTQQPRDPSLFVEALDAHVQAAAWGENPLFFSLAAAVFVSQGVLPSSRAALYREVINSLLEMHEWDRTTKIMLWSVEAHLALRLFEKRKRTFTHSDLITHLSFIRQDLHERWSTEDMVKWIIESRTVEYIARETYGFRHQTFLEYLAAVGLCLQMTTDPKLDSAAQKRAEELAWEKRRYSNWGEVLQLMVGELCQPQERKGSSGYSDGKEAAQKWLQKLIDQRKTEEGDPGNLGLILAMKSLGEITNADWWREKTTTLSQTKNILSIWIDELLNAVREHHQAKQEQLQSLAHNIAHLPLYALDETFQRLMQSVRDYGSMVTDMTCTVLQSLKQIPDEWLTDALTDMDVRVRQAALQVLKAQNKRIPPKQLLDALQDDSGQVRQAAAEALISQAEFLPLEWLRALFQNDDLTIKATAVRALGKLQQRDVLDILIKAMENDEHILVRRAAIEALSAQGQKVSSHILLRALHDPDMFVRINAIKALETRGDNESLKAIVEAMKNDPSADVRVQAVQIAGSMKNIMPINDILKALDDSDSHVITSALNILWAKITEISIDKIIELLNDSRENVRRQAALVLSNQGKRIPLDALVRALEIDDYDIRSTALSMLHAQRDQVSVGRFVKMLSNSSWVERRVAVDVLGMLGEQAPINDLVEMLYDPILEVQLAAAHALGKMGERIPEDKLVGMLDRGGLVRLVRLGVVSALGKLEKGTLIPVLMSTLTDSYRSVKSASLRALGKFGKQVPIDVFLRALTDTDSEVRETAMEVLRSQKERVSSEALIKAFGDTDDLREIAVQVVGKFAKRVPVEVWTKASSDHAWTVRRATVQALQAQGRRVPKNISMKLLRNALNDADERVRRAAIEALGAMGTETPIDDLVKALGDRSTWIREDAIKALGAQGKRAPVGVLLRALADAEWGVRRAAVEALGQLGERIPIERALHDPHEHVRAAAVRALGQLGERIPVPTLLGALSDLEWFVREAAVKVLGEQGERVRLEALVDSLDDPEARVREAAVDAIEKVVKKRKRKGDVEALKGLLADERRYMRLAAVKALGGLGNYVSVDTVLPAFTDDDYGVREAAIEVWGARVPLDTLLESQHYWSLGREATIKAMGTRKDVSSSMLTALLKDYYGPSYARIRAEIAQALGARGKQAPVIVLLGMLEDETGYVRMKVLEVLGEQNLVSIDALLGTLADSEWFVRKAAVKVLGARGEYKIVLGSLGDSDKEVRTSAVEALRKCDLKILKPVIAEAIAILQKQPAGFVLGSLAQTAFLDTVSSIGYTELVVREKVTELLDWPYWEVRMNAARILGVLRRNISEKAIQRLFALRRDPDPLMKPVRRAADEALVEIFSLEPGIEEEG